MDDFRGELGQAYTPTEIVLLRQALEFACANLNKDDDDSRSGLAFFVMRAAVDGERDPMTLAEMAWTRFRINTGLVENRPVNSLPKGSASALQFPIPPSELAKTTSDGGLVPA